MTWDPLPDTPKWECEPRRLDHAYAQGHTLTRDALFSLWDLEFPPMPVSPRIAAFMLEIDRQEATAGARTGTPSIDATRDDASSA